MTRRCTCGQSEWEGYHCGSCHRDFLTRDAIVGHWDQGECVAMGAVVRDHPLAHLPPRWGPWATSMIENRTDGRAFWRVDHLEHLLNKTDLSIVNPEKLSARAQSTLRWLCGWTGDEIEGLAELLNAVTGR